MTHSAMVLSWELTLGGQVLSDSSRGQDNVGQVVGDIGTNVGAIHQGASNTLWSWLNPIKSFKESIIHSLTGGSSQW